MPHELVVTRPFASYKPGDLIRDPSIVAEVLEHSTHERNVVKRVRHEPWAEPGQEDELENDIAKAVADRPTGGNRYSD